MKTNEVAEKIALEIYTKTIIKKEKVWFSKLVDIFEGTFTRSQISQAEDRLFDILMIDAEWEIVENGWVRCYRVSKCYTPYLEELYKRSVN